MIARILPAAVVLLATRSAFAVPDQLTLSARVSDDGARIEGEHDFVVRIFTADTGGEAVWSESDTATAANGEVYLTLGDQEALDSTIIDGGPLWIELQVDGTVLSPRLAVTSAPYAMRAGVCEDAERLGGLTADDFAAADHDHAGAYLPLSSALTCGAGQKVAALDASGSVVCSPDLDSNTTYSAGTGLGMTGTTFNVAFGGSGAASTSARSDHNHSGTYIGVSSSMSCPAGTFVYGINSLGQVSCAAFPSFGGSGNSFQIAHSNHNHIGGSCPVGFSSYSSGPTQICIRWFAGTGPYTWSAAAKQCLVDGGANLCRHEQVLRVKQIDSTFNVTTNYWLGDRIADDMALITDTATGDDIDGEASTLTTHAGYYCCSERTWF